LRWSWGRSWSRRSASTLSQWWKRFGVWAWPTIVLVDKKGISRYSHIGEGAYNKTESVIKQLLADMH
jgi:uncharacterized membrane protein